MCNFFSSNLASCMPNLRRLIINQIPVDSDLQPLKQLENLESLHIQRSDHQTTQLLSLIGFRLKELILDHVPDNNLVISRALVQCPKLEVLSLGSFSGTIDLKETVSSRNLKLKRFVVKRGDFSKAEGFLPLMFKAPLLEQVKLIFYKNLCENDLESIINGLKTEAMFQNLTDCDIHFELRRLWESPYELLCLVKHIVSFCSKLKTANFRPYPDSNLFLEQLKFI